MQKIIRNALLTTTLLTTATFGYYGEDNGSQNDENLRFNCNRDRAYSTGVSDARKGLARKDNYGEICTVNRAGMNSAYLSGYNYGLTNQSGLIINEPAPDHPEVNQQLPSSYTQPYTREAIDGSATNPNIPKSSNNPDNPINQGYRTNGNVAGVYNEEDVSTGDLTKHDPQNGLRSLIDIVPSKRTKCIETATGQACGFNCVNSMNNVRCASSADQICRSNDAGMIACGYNCVATASTVRCSLYPQDNCVSDNNGQVFCGVNCRIEGNAVAVCDIERYAP